MPRRAAVEENIYLDEAEDFILQHTSPSQRRHNPPSPSATRPSQLSASRRKMDWNNEVDRYPEEPMDESYRQKGRYGGEKRPVEEGSDEEDANLERCIICLMGLRDRTILGVCGHEFCFECICIWTNQSRKCPLCSRDMAPFLLHDLDAHTPTKYYLPPLPSKPTFSLPGPSRPRLPSRQERQRWGQRKAEADGLEVQIARRREYYRHGLYVKHTPSNRHSRYRPNPTPKQIADDPSQLQRATAFIRRELHIFPSLDIEFLTTYISSLLKSVDIRSEAMVRLLRDFLDEAGRGDGIEGGAEHFVHELYTFMRSPYNELARYDQVANYGPIPRPKPMPAPPTSVRSSARSPIPSGSRGRSLSLSSYSSLSSYPDRSTSPPHPSSRNPRSRSPPPARFSRRRESEAQRPRRWRLQSPEGNRFSVQQRGSVRRGNGWGVELLPGPQAKKMRVDGPALVDGHDVPPHLALLSAEGGGLLARRLGPVDSMPSLNRKRDSPLDRSGSTNGTRIGLTIRGTARGSSLEVSGAKAGEGQGGGKKLTLKERLERAKAEAVARPRVEGPGKEASPVSQRQPQSVFQMEGEERKLSLKERLERARAQQIRVPPSKSSPAPHIPLPVGQPTSTVSSERSDKEAPSEVAGRETAVIVEDASHQSKRTKLQEKLRLKLEQERQHAPSSSATPPPLPSPSAGPHRGGTALAEVSRAAYPESTSRDQEDQARKDGGQEVAGQLVEAETEKKKRAADLREKLMLKKKALQQAQAMKMSE